MIAVSDRAPRYKEARIAVAGISHMVCFTMRIVQRILILLIIVYGKQKTYDANLAINKNDSDKKCCNLQLYRKIWYHNFPSRRSVIYQLNVV